MAARRIGLMGLGRIGRNLLRILNDTERGQEIEIVAVSDIADHEALAYLVRFDSLLGRFPATVTLAEGVLKVGDRSIQMLSGEKPGDVDWAALGVETVIEATSKFRSRAEHERHLERGAKRVILCSPPLDSPDVTILVGVNDGDLRPEHRIVSNGSCTAHAAAPVATVLAREFGVERMFLSSIHAYTSRERLADVPADDPRHGRAAAENIIPSSTQAASMLEGLIPSLRGKVSGLAMNVPVPNGSLVDLTTWHERPVSVEAINAAMRAAAESSALHGVLAYETEPIVSSDILQAQASSTFDSLLTMTLGERLSKTIAWFDNSWGYSHRVLDLVDRFDRMERFAGFDGEAR